MALHAGARLAGLKAAAERQRPSIAIEVNHIFRAKIQ